MVFWSFEGITIFIYLRTFIFLNPNLSWILIILPLSFKQIYLFIYLFKYLDWSIDWLGGPGVTVYKKRDEELDEYAVRGGAKELVL